MPIDVYQGNAGGGPRLGLEALSEVATTGLEPVT